jgi:hypothetical protein
MTAYKFNAVIISSLDPDTLDDLLAELINNTGADVVASECDPLLEDDVPEWPWIVNEQEFEETGIIVERFLEESNDE